MLLPVHDGNGCFGVQVHGERGPVDGNELQGFRFLVGENWGHCSDRECGGYNFAPGKGYTAEELEKVVESVTVHGVRNEASINLATGVATAEGAEKVITPWRDGEYYKALIVPQSVKEVGLIVVLIGGKEYALKKTFTFETNKRYPFTVTVDKTNNGINVGIGNWEEDGVDHGGVAE